MKDISQAAAALGKRGGSVTSDRKAAASRENGKKGGAPRKCQCGHPKSDHFLPNGCWCECEAYRPLRLLR